MATISQFMISESVKFFQKAYELEFGLQCVNESGYNPYEPCLFVGCYRPEDTNRIFEHESQRIVIWMGLDMWNADILNRMLMFNKPVTHIAISEEGYNHMNSHDIPAIYRRVPNTYTDYWVPTQLGTSVYCYAPNEKYGLSIAKSIESRLGNKYPFIFTNDANQYSWSQLRDLYSQSFVGIRPRQYDGCPASVNEMGLMGRKTVSNVDNPAALPWRNEDDIIEAIEEQSRNIGKKIVALPRVLRTLFRRETDFIRAEY